jgi:hypothetical protein
MVFIAETARPDLRSPNTRPPSSHFFCHHNCILTSTCQPPLFAKPRAPKHHAKTNLCQCKPKRQAKLYERWLHLSSGKTNLQFTLQVTLATISTFIAAMTWHLALVLAVKTLADANDVDYDAVNAAVISIAIVLMAFLGLLHAV